jgi:hypothetical protein
MEEYWRERIESDGYVQLAGVFDAAAVDAMTDELGAALVSAAAGESAIRSESGVVYAARNVRMLWPRAADVWQISPLLDVLTAVLGPDCGLVRALFFDKPPGQTWALPWHKDVTIAVRDNRLPSARFEKPTRKAGVPHVEAPLEVLQGMLTARIHLDAVTDENGPLKVIPGSHRSGTTLAPPTVAPTVLHAARGDVLLMRPLLAHCSGKSSPDTSRHRRVLHLEFASSPFLPDGYAWHDYTAARHVAPATSRRS